MNNIIFVTKPSAKARAIEKELRAKLEAADVRLKTPVVVAIGGDGTMLHAIREHMREDVLFVGVSAGHLGFLQTVEPTHSDELAAALASGGFHTVSSPLLVAKTFDGRVLGHAFNEITLERSGPRAARVSLSVGSSAGTFIGDGIIMATPMGSTAYSLAAGGPIIDAAVQDVMVVTPSNPHVSEQYSSLQRPHVLGRQRHVRLDQTAGDAAERPVKLTGDGFDLADNIVGGVEVSLSRLRVRLIELEPGSYHDRLETKRLGRY
jgi:NAD+ kinase